MKDFNQELIDFIKDGTCAFTCVKKIKEILTKLHYQDLSEETSWDLKKGNYFITKNDASIIAFKIPKDLKEGFHIVCTHSDTPGFLIKPNPEYYENGYLKLNVMPYGGILNYGFMDIPLSLAGRMIVKKKNQFQKEIIDLKDPIAVIPSIAIHQNNEANTNLDLNVQQDLMPLFSLKKDFSLEKLLKEYHVLKDSLYDFDFYLYHNEEPIMIHDEFLSSPRIDNLTCSFAALKSFIEEENEWINVLSIFNSEEIGSNTLEGADSNFLVDTLKKICRFKELDFLPMLDQSMIISADNTHAMHPNHQELKDHTNDLPLNSGILIMREMNGTTNSISSTIFRHICEENNLPCSFYTSKNDTSSGSTLAGASLKHLSILSLDIGLAMLAMHSGRELIGIHDTYTMYQALKGFYRVKFFIKGNKILFK